MQAKGIQVSAADYQEALDYIKNLTKFGINLGLGRIQALMQRLGNPEKRLRIIHVGGTNGKGSTTAILQSVLQEAGYRVGMFISPHLHDFRERFTINRELISEERVCDLIAMLKPHLNALVAEGVEHPTEFEVSTALALMYFAQEKPDFVLLEVGLGGEIDSTNVVTPLVSVITSIGMDHMDYLGDTLARIAAVKAGIIKPGIPVVTSADQPEVLEVLYSRARERDSKMIVVGRDIHWEGLSGTDRAFRYEGILRKYEKLEIGLYGRHQYINASAALAVCEVLAEQYGVMISEESVRRGLAKVRWPGRLEVLNENPKILLDGAHNAEGMQSLVQALEDYRKGPFKRNRLILCLGMLQDKEIGKALDLILPLADELVVTRPDSPRAGDWRNIAVLAEQYLALENIQAVEDPIEAVKAGIAKTGEDDLLCITGSLYMIAPVRKYLLSV